MRKKFRYNPMSTEVELDLAPLLAVMVKLVPVLIVSSAFVQITLINTELPQAVQEAIQKDPDPQTTITVSMSSKKGFAIEINDKGKVSSKLVPPDDFEGYHKELQALKTQYPSMYKLELKPDGDVPYEKVVKAMDLARQSQSNDVTFPVFDKTLNREIRTPFMFPEVVLANVIEG